MFFCDLNYQDALSSNALSVVSPDLHSSMMGFSGMLARLALAGVSWLQGLPGLCCSTLLLAWAGVGASGRRDVGEPWPSAWAGVGLPGRNLDGELGPITLPGATAIIKHREMN